MLLNGLAFFVSNGWIETPLAEDSTFLAGMGFNLSEFLGKVNHGIYKEFK